MSGTYTSANFHVGKDASGHVLVTYVATAAVAATDEVRGESSADLLGGYGSQFSSPIPRKRIAAQFNSWLSPVPGAGTDTGGFAFHQDGNVGGARDAWGVGAGWDGRFGHGPGSAS